MRDRRKANPKKYSMIRREWGKKNKNLEKVHSYRKKARKWGINPIALLDFIATHPKTCDICEKHESEVGTLHLDHCHTLNNVRGLLCSKCNLGIGQFDNSVNNLNAAIAYLNKTPSLLSGTITKANAYHWSSKDRQRQTQVAFLKLQAETDRRSDAYHSDGQNTQDRSSSL